MLFIFFLFSKIASLSDSCTCKIVASKFRLIIGDIIWGLMLVSLLTKVLGILGIARGDTSSLVCALLTPSWLGCLETPSSASYSSIYGDIKVGFREWGFCDLIMHSLLYFLLREIYYFGWLWYELWAPRQTWLLELRMGYSTCTYIISQFLQCLQYLEKFPPQRLARNHVDLHIQDGPSKGSSSRYSLGHRFEQCLVKKSLL